MHQPMRQVVTSDQKKSPAKQISKVSEVHQTTISRNLFFISRQVVQILTQLFRIMK